MKLLLSAAVVAVTLSVAACGGTPSGQELLNRADTAAEKEQSIRYKGKIRARATTSNKTSTIETSFSGSENIGDGNFILKVGSDSVLQKTDSGVYLAYNGETIKLPIRDSQKQDLVGPAVGQGFFRNFSSSDDIKIKEGPVINGTPTWVWEPDTKNFFYKAVKAAEREILKVALLNELGSSNGNKFLGKLNVSKKELAKKASIASSGVSVKIYFSKSSDLNVGYKLTANWTKSDVENVFRIKDTALFLELMVKIDYSKNEVQIPKPQQSVSIDSVWGQNIQDRALNNAPKFNVSEIIDLLNGN